MSRAAKHPLDPQAVAAADAALAEITGGRPLTMGPEDAELRARWMDHYLAAGGEIEGEDWGSGTPDDPVQDCPYADDETYVWFYSA
jgi:hypothetical protein